MQNSSSMRLCFLLGFVLLISCQTETTKSSIAELPAINLSVSDIGQKLEGVENENQLIDLEDTSPALGNIILSSILKVKDQKGNIKYPAFEAYQKDSSILDLNRLIRKNYPQENTLTSMLTPPLQHLEYFVPSYEVPNIYTWNSGLQYQVFLFEDGSKDGVCIGLDFFLGDDFAYTTLSTQNPNFSAYNARTFNRDHLPRKVMDGILSDLAPYPKTERMLDLMIYNGKKLYILEQIMPTVPDTVIFEYTPQQMKWCTENEKEMWAYFLDKNLFYETDMRKINKLVNPSPSSPGMPDDAPGRTANYVGYQIVKQYMLRQPEVTIPDLIAEMDAQKILDLSRYKPRS